jgi:hypothetical protein
MKEEMKRALRIRQAEMYLRNKDIGETRKQSKVANL